MYNAPQRFADWMSRHRHYDPKLGITYLYHSRSDKHSIALCRFVIDDLVEASASLRKQASSGEIAYGINVPFRAPNGKTKNLDFAIGTPLRKVTSFDRPSDQQIAFVKEIGALRVACEAKSAMTEHSKSKPRLFDELSSSHEIIHQGDPNAIATGIAVINIAGTFLSPLRQKSDTRFVSQHKQPGAAGGMVAHLRGLKLRENSRDVGFEAFCTIVIDCDNVTCATLFTKPPAPQQADWDSYKSYVDRVTKFYEERFS
jgi:hypothetical protein